MPGSRAARIVFAIWAVFAFVTWNVVFDRHVYLAGVRFTEEQVERHQGGEPVRSIESAFRPHVRIAAVDASIWGGSVLVAGLICTALVRSKANGS